MEYFTRINGTKINFELTVLSNSANTLFVSLKCINSPTLFHFISDNQIIFNSGDYLDEVITAMLAKKNFRVERILRQESSLLKRDISVLAQVHTY